MQGLPMAQGRMSARTARSTPAARSRCTVCWPAQSRRRPSARAMRRGLPQPMYTPHSTSDMMLLGPHR